MTTPEATQAAIHWATLVPVIVGAAAAAVGGVPTAIVSNRVKEKSERKKKRAEKFEEMVDALHEHEHWLDGFRTRLVYETEVRHEFWPLRKAQTIAVIYFPVFNGRLQELELKAREYHRWVLEEALRRSSAEPRENENERFNAEYASYWRKFIEVRNEMEAYAEHEFS